MDWLKNKVIIVTGASSGIGAASSRLFSKHGARVVLAARSTYKLRQVSKGLSHESLVVPTDVTKAKSVTNLIDKTLQAFGRIDVLFANAGIYIPGQMAEGDPDAWANLMNIDIDGVLRCVHAVLPHMSQQKSGDIAPFRDL